MKKEAFKMRSIKKVIGIATVLSMADTSTENLLESALV